MDLLIIQKENRIINYMRRKPRKIIFLDPDCSAKMLSQIARMLEYPDSSTTLADISQLISLQFTYKLQDMDTYIRFFTKR